MSEWETRLAAWLGDLDVGAELEVRDLDGSLLMIAPLARHYRLDEDDAVLWVRPVVGGYAPERGEPGKPPYAFHLNEARARAISSGEIRVEGPGLVAPQDGGRVAHIRPAGPATKEELERWDTFLLTVLSTEDEAALNQVWGDS